MKKIAILISLLILPATAIAASSSCDLANDYQRDHAKGYWFYDDPEPEPEPHVTPPPPIQPSEDIKKPKKPTRKTEPKDEKIELTVEWLQANMKKFMHDAMDHPEDPDKVRAWLYMQRLMMDKSQRFADATQRALLTDPFLDENTRRPIATFGGTQANREAEKIMKNLFDRLSARVGLWFFFREKEMGMNQVQADVLEMFQRTTGITVQAISMDGSELPEGLFANAKMDRGQSKLLKIAQTPALFIVNPSTNQIMPLSQAALALPDLKKRVLVAAASVDWISEDDFERSRGMRSELTLDSTPVVKQSTISNPKKIADEFQKILQKRAQNDF